MQTLGGVQNDLQELQLQETKIQVDVRKESNAQGSLAQGKSTFV